MHKICKTCKRKFVPKDDRPTRPAKFCSRKCVRNKTQFKKGHEMRLGLKPPKHAWDNENSKKTRFQKGHKINQGKTPWNKNKPWPKKVREKLSEATKRQWKEGKVSPNVYEILKKGQGWNKGIPGPRGENHPHWKGGLNDRWMRDQVRRRDNYICQLCGLSDLEIMEVDHIKPRHKFPDLQFRLDNLLILCPNCHRRKTLRERKTWKRH